MADSNIILFIVQGITEFFPISSTAHLHLYSKIVSHSFTLTDSMLLDLVPGIIFLMYFWRDVYSLLLGLFEVGHRVMCWARIKYSEGPSTTSARRNAKLSLCKERPDSDLTQEPATSDPAACEDSSLASRQVTVTSGRWPDPNAAIPPPFNRRNSKKERSLEDLLTSGQCIMPYSQEKCSLNATFFYFVLWSVIPTLICGALISLLKISIPNSVRLIGINSIIFGTLLGLADYIHPLYRVNSGKLLGLFHILACIPGVSRLGICLTVTRAMGLSRRDAARLSFVCGIPVMLAAGGMGLLQGASSMLPLLAPSMLMFIIGVISLRLFLSYIKKHSLLFFAIYRVCLGILLLVI
ncbi:MAG: undecaprenyl-diphosphate phosphatase [Holosporales bacterium]|jgi:undecaprenyl-diphosphatase|nr:undecaprenyl-diphosphate phosphatase [Holosporales bacterium]